jgi:hypothetical protein
MSSSTVPTYQLSVTLQGSDPAIWRQIQVPATITLERLHRVLQVAMGWEDDHLHQFIAGNKQYGAPMPGDLIRVRDESQARLYRVLPRPRARMLYEYDFGDGWIHEIVLEEVLRPEQAIEHPVCSAGERACPPEDCGGIWGYYGMLEAIRDPKHPEHEGILDWMGEDFDPEAFDRVTVNRRLKQIGGRRRDPRA